MEKKTKVILIAMIAGILAFLFAVLAIFAVFEIIASDDEPENTAAQEETTVTFVAESVKNIQPEDDTAADEVVASVYVPVTSESAINNEQKFETVLSDNSFYIVSGTPDSAGLVMRSAASSTSENLGTLPEGSRVYVYSDDASNNTGYVRVLTEVGNSDINCYILKRYLRFESVFDDNETSDTSTVRYVSFNTPAHTGINMRIEPSSAADKICSISEGERVDIADISSQTVNGYIKVSYAHPYAGEIYTGWVLEEYLVK